MIYCHACNTSSDNDKWIGLSAVSSNNYVSISKGGNYTRDLCIIACPNCKTVRLRPDKEDSDV
jgi:hypothetical protein